MYQVYNKDYIH